jgi:hypothetical protein
MAQANWGPPAPWGPPGPPPPFGAAPPPWPPPRPPRLRPKASATVALPIVGSALIAACLVILPWVHVEATDDWLVLPQIIDRLDGKGEGFGLSYISFVSYPMAFFGILYAFAANLDSVVMRWVHFAFVAMIGFSVVSLALVASLSHSTNAYGEDLGSSGVNARAVFAIVVAVLVTAFFLGLALVRGLAIRVIGGLMLIGYMMVHTVALFDLLDKKVELLPFAFVATIGYLLCAIGAFVGPRYVLR